MPPKNQIYQFTLKFGTEINSNIQISMALFTFPVFIHKYSVWTSLILKSKVSLNLIFDTYNTSHNCWDQYLFPIINVVYKYLRQFLGTNWCCYSSNISYMPQNWLGPPPDLFPKKNHSRISRIFSRNWFGFNNLCKTLSQNLKKLGK